LDSFGTDFLDTENSSYQQFRQRQAVVLIEQRGTLYSEPFLFCNELEQLQEEMLNFEVPVEEIETRRREALTACRDRFQAVGINLSAYNSVENAADMAMVMTALGYDQFNFYGVSYGTMLAQHLMRDYPHRLRSVILDSVVPLNVNFVTKTANTGDRSLRLLFQKCAEDRECNQNFPNLEQVFFDTVDYLNQSPGLLFVKDPAGKPYFLFFTGDDFMMGQVFTLLYVTQLIPYLPAIIYQVAGGDYSSAERLFGLLIFDSTSADGMGNSVICAEDADYTDADYDTTGLYPQMAARVKDGDVRDTCEIWNVAPLGNYVDNPVVSDIPTLVLSGEMDPVTPSSFGEEVAKYLSQGYAYTFPGVGHGVIGGGECPQSMMLAFLETPSQRPDDRCLATLGIQFATEFPLPSGQRMRQAIREVRRFKRF
jgi:pimeloyl-ACP methyl ester carboxylesterase